MKITVIGPTYPYKGGISHFTTILVRELRKKHQVDFISWSRQYPNFLYPVEPKDTESKYVIKEDARYTLDFINPITWFQAFLEIRRFKPDKVILTWIVPYQAPIYFFIGLLSKVFTKSKIMYICHNVLPHEQSPLDKPLAKLAFSISDEIIVHSKEDGGKAKKLASDKKIINGFLPIFNMYPIDKKFNLDQFKKKLKLKKKVLLFFGYIRPYKGLKYLIQAMPQIVKDFPDLTLLVVGQFWSNDKVEYMKMVGDLGVKKDIVFVSDYVPNEDVFKYFLVSDVVVTPYVSATQSAIIQTAYSFNKPVISTTVGGLNSIVEDNKTGLVIDPGNPDDIFIKIASFYSSKRVYDLETQTSKFSWKQYMHKAEI